MIHSVRKNLPFFLDKTLYLGYKFPLIKILSSHQAVVLLYHGVPSTGDASVVHGNTFERHITFLKKHCHFITPDQLEKPRKALDKIHVLLTFDDGLCNNATVVAPILRKYEVPAVFFVSSRHATPGKYLWFVYLNALEKYFPGNGFLFRGECINMSQQHRRANMQRLTEWLLQLRPHPAAMYQVLEDELPPLEDFLTQQDLDNHCAGMTAEQVGELAADPLFSLGVHTIDHPFLSRCDTQEIVRQIQENKDWLEKSSGKPCHIMAYPSGDYNAEVLQHVRHLDFSYGYAVTQHLKTDAWMEIPRVGIYAPSLHVLGFKIQWGRTLRELGIKMG